MEFAEKHLRKLEEKASFIINNRYMGKVREAFQQLNRLTSVNSVGKKEGSLMNRAYNARGLIITGR